MNFRKVSAILMIMTSFIISGCNDEPNRTPSPKAVTVKTDKKDMSFYEIALNHKETEEKMPKQCPKEHREILSKIGITVPENEKLGYNVGGKNDSILYGYNFPQGEYGHITIRLYDEGENIGKIKNVETTHSVDNCNATIFAIKDGQIIGKLDDVYKKHLEEDKKAKKAIKNVQSSTPSYQASNSSSISNQEFMSDFNTVMSNQYKGLYAGSELSIGAVTAGTVRIYVSPLWYSLNEGQKNAFVSQTVKWYFGMMGARQMSYNMDRIDLFFRDANTGSQVAKWGSVRGVVIDK